MMKEALFVVLMGMLVVGTILFWLLIVNWIDELRSK